MSTRRTKKQRAHEKLMTPSSGLLPFPWWMSCVEIIALYSATTRKNLPLSLLRYTNADCNVHCCINSNTNQGQVRHLYPFWTLIWSDKYKVTFYSVLHTLQSFRSGNSRTRFMTKLWKRPYAPVKKGHRYMHFTGNIREYSERITTYTLNMVLVFHYYVKRFHSISKLWFGNLQKNALYEPYPEKCWNRFSIFTNWFRIGSGLGRNPLQCVVYWFKWEVILFHTVWVL